ncbi:kinase-like domain-containing protein [Tribonema minus]|uniref:non-specific serine/threonine protein kinase n=1 Tax=Tribonema minus TaxID=303371 RepID=A0A836CRJ1_9STRA|nr:kinase-like domain-containing protein [Tribonema minus]
MASLRRPKRLTIHGDDERDAPFLVKGGEDLRLDERIEQLFEIMNAAFRADAACARARLAVKTYQVIPMTHQLGVLQWVTDTAPLRAIVETQLTLDPAYLRRYQDHFLAMAPSPQAFLTVRAAFARSLAVFNVCAYIVGIGDRHLDNFLLDLTTGAVVGIDFGAAFGFATSHLPVPELIPFRLTRQLRGALAPLDAVGLMRDHMCAAARALRAAGEGLLNAMDVFLHEPILDWAGGVKRSQDDVKAELSSGSDVVDLISMPSAGADSIGGGGGGGSAYSSEARRKVGNARAKLAGAHPSAVVVADLEHNAAVAKFKSLAAWSAVAWGEGSGAARAGAAHCGAATLSAAAQVDCLIDLATDPDVLGRAWIGLALWL